jgi:hypothetical protein
MKTVVFEVPKKLIRDFAERMDDHELDNRIQGVFDGGDIEIAVHYETDQKDVINEIQDMIDEHNDSKKEQK